MINLLSLKYNKKSKELANSPWLFLKKIHNFKHLCLTLISYFLLSFNSSVFAITVGNYFGVDLVTTSLNFQNLQYFQSSTMSHRHTNSSSTQSFGLNYNYAINYDNFFLAPGIIFEKNDTLNNLNRQSNNNGIEKYYKKSFSSIKKRYGIKLDLGYDISNEIAVYGTIGKAVNYYKNFSSSIRYDDYTGLIEGPYCSVACPAVTENPFRVAGGKKHALFYGGGFRMKIKNDWYLTGEYNQSKFSTNNHGLNENLKLAPQANIVNGAFYYDGEFLYNIAKTNKFKNVMKVYKLGISYNF